MPQVNLKLIKRKANHEAEYQIQTSKDLLK